MRRMVIGLVMGLVMVSLGVMDVCSVAMAHPNLVDEEARAARVAVMKAFPGATIRDWQPAPMAGMFMFTVNTDERVFFVDGAGRYLLAQAALFDLEKQENWTQGFIFAKRRELLAAVPLGDAILYEPSQVTDGMKATSPVLVFDDPDCPFCRELHEEVKQLVLAGVPVAVFLHPVERLHKGATRKSMNIWCAEKRQETMDAALAGKVVPEVAQPCDTPIERNLQLARRLGGGPTPYIVLPDGRTVTGKKSAAELLSMLGKPATVAQQLGQDRQ